MPDPVTITRAELWELNTDSDPVRTVPGSRVPVQFNPETLKVSFSNRVNPPTNGAAGPQPGGASAGGTPGSNSSTTSAMQFVGKGATKLGLQLWFDVSALADDQALVTDVRRLTKQVANFMQPRASKQTPANLVPPAVRFLWGTFQFDGIMDSLDETLEFFSADGRPLRANLALTILQQDFEFQFADAQSLSVAASRSGLRTPGAQPLVQATTGQSLQDLAAQQGRATDWQAIAMANGIENPRLMPPGQLINFSVG